MPAVEFLNSASADGYASMAAAFKRGLKEAGYAEGQNVTIEYRWADNQYERLPKLVLVEGHRWGIEDSATASASDQPAFALTSVPDAVLLSQTH